MTISVEIPIYSPHNKLGALGLTTARLELRHTVVHGFNVNLWWENPKSKLPSFVNYSRFIYSNDNNVLSELEEFGALMVCPLILKSF